MSKRPATNNQKKLLDKFGISYRRQITYKEAHDIISREVSNRKSKSYISRPNRKLGRFGFPSLGPPGGIVRDIFGGSATYGLWGGIETVFVPNFGEVDVWED